MLRAEVASGSPLGLQFSETIKAGKLVELDLVLDLVEKAMLKAIEGGAKGFLIDGYPRDVDQGKRFEEKVNYYLKYLMIISLVISKPFGYFL